MHAQTFSQTCGAAPLVPCLQAEELLNSLYTVLKQVELAVSTQQPDFVSVRTNSALQLVARLELLQAPGLPFVIPKVGVCRLPAPQHALCLPVPHLFKAVPPACPSSPPPVAEQRARLMGLPFDLHASRSVGLGPLAPRSGQTLQEYANLPRLTGRSVVELQVEQRDGALAFVDPVKGGLTSTGIIQVQGAESIFFGNFKINTPVSL